VIENLPPTLSKIAVCLGHLRGWWSTRDIGSDDTSDIAVSEALTEMESLLDEVQVFTAKAASDAAQKRSEVEAALISLLRTSTACIAAYDTGESPADDIISDWNTSMTAADKALGLVPLTPE